MTDTDDEDGFVDADDADLEDGDVDDPETTGESKDGEDQPDLEDDAMADLDAIAEDVAAAETEDADSEDAEDSDEDESDQDETGSTDRSDGSTDGSTSSNRSWGTMYTKGVVKASEAIVSEFGDDESEPVTEADVHDLELDEAFNEWMATKTGRPEDIPPGQWVGIGTIMLLGGNALTETDAIEEALDGI